MRTGLLQTIDYFKKVHFVTNISNYCSVFYDLFLVALGA